MIPTSRIVVTSTPISAFRKNRASIVSIQATPGYSSSGREKDSPIPTNWLIVLNWVRIMKPVHLNSRKLVPSGGWRCRIEKASASRITMPSGCSTIQT